MQQHPSSTKFIAVPSEAPPTQDVSHPPPPLPPPRIHLTPWLRVTNCEQVHFAGWGYADTRFELNAQGHVCLTGSRYPFR
jgi:hypothetical protein